MRIFLVEDDKELNHAITSALQNLGFEVNSYLDSELAMNELSNTYDIYFIDLHLPKVDGLTIIQEIKKFNIEAPIFIISGDNSIDSIEKAYEIGCQDYIKKPFDVKELLIKISKVFNKTNHIVQVAKNVEYNLFTEELFIKGQPLLLTKKEKDLFHILAKNIGTSVSNERIESYVWGTSMENGYVRQLVSKLRKKLPKNLIKNHTSSGYYIDTYKK